MLALQQIESQVRQRFHRLQSNTVVYGEALSLGNGQDILTLYLYWGGRFLQRKRVAVHIDFRHGTVRTSPRGARIDLADPEMSWLDDLLKRVPGNDRASGQGDGPDSTRGGFWGPSRHMLAIF